VLKRLAKRDPVTKLKALDDLRPLVAAKDPEDVAKLLPRWVRHVPGAHSSKK